MAENPLLGQGTHRASLREMLRITSERNETRSVVHIEGQLRGKDVRLFEEVCDGIQGQVDVDLAELREIDDDGVATLLRLRQRGGCLIGASPYIGLRLETAERYSSKR